MSKNLILIVIYNQLYLTDYLDIKKLIMTPCWKTNLEFLLATNRNATIFFQSTTNKERSSDGVIGLIFHH